MALESDFVPAELLELLHFRDQAFANAAEEAERRIRYTLIKEHSLRIESQLIDQIDLLQENMTRAYNAEKKVLELELKIDLLQENMTRAYNAEKKMLELELKIQRLSDRHQAEIQLIRSSLTWRIGHFFLIPLRLLRALKRS